MMDEITVGVVSYFSTQQLVHLYQNLLNTATESKLRFIICDNTNQEDQELYETLGRDCEIFPFAPANPRKRNKEKASGSYAHALGLNYLLSKVNTQFSLFLDPDCLVLAKGWDIICKDHLVDSMIAFGAPYHSRKIIKYSNFPSPIFVFFNPDRFRHIKADWLPYTESNLIYLWDQVLRVIAICGARLGEVFAGDAFYSGKEAEWMRRLFGGSSKDTGWRIPILARQNGFSSQLINPVTVPHQLLSQIAGNSEVLELMRNYELFAFQGVPFLTHFYGTRHRFVTDKKIVLKQWRELALSVASSCEDNSWNQPWFDGCRR